MIVLESFGMLVASSGGAVAWGPDLDVWLRFMGRLHPAIVHFPIALILTAALVEFLCSFRDGHRLSRMGVTCLALGAVSAGLAAWFGWLNAEFEPQSNAIAETLLFHRWIGITSASLAGLAVIWAIVTRFSKAHWPGLTYRLTLFVAVLAISAGSYLGGEMVHGEDYLLAVFKTPATPSPEPSNDTPASEPTVLAHDTPTHDAVRFEDHVRPILVARCAECHGPDRQRGQLALEPINDAFAGDRANWVIVPGAPDDSPLVKRINLPADDVDRMPKRGDPLSADQISVIERWIAQGAVIESATRPSAGAAAMSFQRDRAIAAIEQRGGTAVPIAAGDTRLDINLGLADPPATDDDLAMLDGIEPLVVRLTLSGSAITDHALERVARCTNLQRLRLDGTAITDSGLVELDTLGRLESLNLYGTGVTDPAVERLVAALPRLRIVYLWQTPVTDESIARLATLRPDLEIVRGAPH